MSPELAGEILACLCGERTLFRYAPDRYARLLLSRLFPEGARIADLRRGPHARLLDRPGLRPVLAAAGDGWLGPERLRPEWSADESTYRLTLDRWGSPDGYRRANWEQTSRAGVNLVLQLNFAGDHNAAFRQLVDPFGYRPFDRWSHPSRRDRDMTLAWARIDLDLVTGEALVEEVQSDWVRLARRAADEDGNCRSYADEVLAPHAALWDEAMLAAAILFVTDEIGLSTVWYHTHATGTALKNALNPPRSLYRDLPERFTFTRVDEAPRFLRLKDDRRMRRLKREGRFGFYRLTFPSAGSAATVGPGSPASGAVRLAA